LPSEPRAENSALEFNGNDTYVTVPTLVYDGSHPLTVEATIRPFQDEFKGCVIAKGPRLELLFPCGNGPAGKRKFGMFHVRDESPVGLGPSSAWTAEPITPKQRINVAAILNGESIALFVEGKRQGSEVKTNYQADSSSFMIGSSRTTRLPKGQGSFFNGVIDEVRISKVARYTSNFVPAPRFDSDSDTLALYHFDEGQGDVLTHASGNSHHGKITNAKWVPGIAGGPQQ